MKSLTLLDRAFLRAADLGDFESVVDAERLGEVEGRLARRILMATLVLGATIAGAKSIGLFARGGDSVLTASFGVQSLVFGGLIVLLARGARRRLVASIGLGTFALALVAGTLHAMYTGNVAHHFWAYTFVPTALAVSGRRRGVMWCVAVGVICVPLLAIHAHKSPELNLGPLFREGAFAMVVILALIFTYESLRDRYQRMLGTLNERLEALATTDQLTGAFNRRMMERLLSRARERLREPEAKSAVMIVDLDHFKQVNDRFGHEAGDRVLERFVEVARTVLRNDDEIGRWGGEEFLVLSHARSPEVVVQIADRLRETIATHDFGIGAPVTISIGLALRQPHEDQHALLRRADAALYAAKDGGRDQVVLAD